MTARIGLITDVHADVHALTDALRWLDAAGVTTVLCAGDLVDYGVFPDETVALLARRKITTVRGNYDRWATAEGTVRRAHDGSIVEPWRRAVG